MSALVYLSPSVRACQYLDATPGYFHLTDDGYAVELPATGDHQEPLMANKPVVLKTTPIKVKKYTAIVSINPKLLEAGVATCQTILTSGEGEGFAVYFTPRKAFDLASLDYLVRIALID